MPQLTPMTKMLVPSDIPDLLNPGASVLLPGRILVKPHGTLICQGKKKAVLSSRLTIKYLGLPLYLIEGNKALGIIILHKPKYLSLKEIKKLRKKHRVSDKEIKAWWPEKKFLYYYPVELVSKFEPPKEISRPEGAQTWLTSVTFKKLDFTDPNDLTDEELLDAHRKLHKMWFAFSGPKEDILNYHILLVREMENRKFGHQEMDELDKKSRQFKERFSKAGFKVSFFGSKGLVEEEGPGHRFHTSILYEYSGKRLLIDYGKENQNNIKEIKPDYILISHAHPDHIGGCSDLSVFVSEDTKKEIPNLYKDFNIDCRTTFRSYKTFKLGPFKITPIPVLHSTRAKTHVFLIEMGDKRVLQATDILGWHSGDRKKYIRKLDLAIIDGSSLTRTLARRKGKDGEPYGHASLQVQLKNWYKPEEVKRIVVTHLGKETLSYGDEILLTKLRKLTEIPLAIANDNKIINLSEGFAPVYTSGKVQGRRITLEEVLKNFKPFLIQVPLVYLTGGLVNQGSTRGDIDLLLPEWLSWDMRRIIEFRIARSFPIGLRERLHFVYDRFSTPFTNAIPLYDLAMLKSRARKIKMSEINKKLREKPRDIGARKDAEISANEDKVKLFRYFLPLKPTRGYYPEKRQTIDLFIEVMEHMGSYPFYSEKKYDGVNSEIHYDGKKKVIIFSEDGDEITRSLPTFVEQIKSLTNKPIILLGEIEQWRNGKHLPRESCNGLIHRKTGGSDDELVVNIYDIVYFEKDIHNLPFEERLKILESLPFKQKTFDPPDLKIKFNLVPHLLSKNKEELRKHTEFLRKLEGSEGNVCKTRDFKYNLEGIRSGMVKFHNSTTVHGRVLKIKETKVKGVYNYYFGFKSKDYKAQVEKLGNEFYHRSGRTFSTSIKAKIGDVLEIEGETLNAEHNLKNNTWKLSLWAPRVMKRVKREPDSIEEAIKRAKKNYCLQEKEITKEGKIIYLSEIKKLHLKEFKSTGVDDDLRHPKKRKKELIADLRYLGNSAFPRLKRGEKWGEWTMIDVLRYFAKIVDTLHNIGVNIQPRKKSGSWYECWQRAKKYMKTRVEIEKQSDPYLDYPGEKRKWKYVIQHHFRGKSCHSDLRIEHDNYLIGWTLMDQIKGKITKPVLTLKEAKEIDAGDNFKINWKRGVPKLRPGIKPGFKKKYAELAAARKAKEPKEWLNVQGITPKGEVGATKEYPGVFHIIDRGFCEYGMQKSYAHEYFFSEGKLKGRWFFRQLRASEFKGKVKKQEIIPPSRETNFRQEAPWFFIKPLDETPYVISKAAVNKNWIPPQGISALPKAIRDKIPKEFQYWKHQDKKQRIKIRNELVKTQKKELVKGLEAEDWARAAYRYILAHQQYTTWIRLTKEEKIKRVKDSLLNFQKLSPLKEEWKAGVLNWLKRRPNEIKNLMIEEIQSYQVLKGKKVKFSLQWHFWRGQKVIRAGVSRQHWDLRLDFPDRKGLMHFVLDQNPLKNSEVTALSKPCPHKEWLDFSGYLPPANERVKMSKEELKKFPPGLEEANPTKSTSCYMQVLDKGKAVVFEDSDSFKKFQFEGKKLKGLWTFEREDLSKFWTMKQSSLPSPS